MRVVSGDQSGRGFVHESVWDWMQTSKKKELRALQGLPENRDHDEQKGFDHGLSDHGLYGQGIGHH